MKRIIRAGYLLIGINFVFSIVLLISGIESEPLGLFFLAAYTFISWRLYKWRKREVNEQIGAINKRIESWMDRKE